MQVQLEWLHGRRQHWLYVPLLPWKPASGGSSDYETAAVLYSDMVHMFLLDLAEVCLTWPIPGTLCRATGVKVFIQPSAEGGDFAQEGLPSSVDQLKGFHVARCGCSNLWREARGLCMLEGC